MQAPRLALVAGEASGDLLAGLLLQGLRQRWPHLQAQGIGGPRMAEQGFEAWWPHHKLAVSGYVEVLRHFREILGIRRQLQERLLQSPPQAFIGVDAPDFNLDLEVALKARGVKTVQFVCPSIWAWRPQRVEKIRRACDHVLCLFPFEPALLAQHGIAATYVGHPLASVIAAEPDRAKARAAAGLPPEGWVVALLPGSRAAEVHQLAEPFFQAAKLMVQTHPLVRFVVPAASGRRPLIEAALRQAQLGERVVVLDGQSHTALAACDVALVASGTATLEAALFKRPMVVAYRVNPLSAVIMRRQRLQPWVGLPNILLGDFAVPELLQQDCTPQRLAQAALDWLAAPDKMAAVQQRFAQLHAQLAQDTSALATHAIEKVLQTA